MASCNYCYTPNLEWVKTERGPRLQVSNTANLHVCPPGTIKPYKKKNYGFNRNDHYGSLKRAVWRGGATGDVEFD